MPDEPLINAMAPAATPDSAARAPGDLAAAPLFRFGLRQLFWIVAVISMLLAGIVTTGGLSAVVFLLAAIVVMAHLFATALGSRLRDQADRRQGWDPANSPAVIRDKLSRDGAARMAYIRATARSPWHGRGSTNLPWLPKVVGAAVVVGGLVGAAIIALTARRETSVAGIVVGAFSMAVLGGWAAFLGGSFYGVFRHGFRDAMVEQKKDESRYTFWH
jgi:hypothetical protein